MREWMTRLFDSFRRRRLERDLQDELRFHREQIQRELFEHGDHEAARLARMRLGDVARISEDARDRWSIPWISHLWRDTRHAMRSLRRAPAFTLAVIATLSLGIGANAAMFEVTDRLISRPLKRLRDPGSVHRVYMRSNLHNTVDTTSWLPFGRYQDLVSETSSFSRTAAFVERTVMTGSGDLARERRIAGVTASYFEFFDAPAVRGRYFVAAEDVAPTGSAVAVISHRFWIDAYAGANVIGQSLQVGSSMMTVIGVAHPAMKGVTDVQAASVFVPITAMGPIGGGPQASQVSAGYTFFWGHMLVRRRDGVSVDTASADLTQAFRRSWDRQRSAVPDMDLPPVEQADPRAFAGGVRLGAGPSPSLEVRTARWVAGVAIVVLLIACANVGNLMLARAIARQREVSVRAALGAGPARLILHALSESLLLSCVSTIAAAFAAAAVSNAIFGILVPAADQTLSALATRTVAVAALTGLIVGLLLGCVPALFAASPTLSLRSGERGAGSQRPRVRAVLVVFQAALSVVLLIGAVQFVQSLNAARNAPMGYEPERVLLVNANIRGTTLDPNARIALRRRLLDAAVATPGVEAAAWRTSLPLALNGAGRFFVDGADSIAALGQFSAQNATPAYFDVMGIRLVRGRAFTETDDARRQRVVIVSESMARVLWPAKDALGQCVRFGQQTAPCTTVVGISEDVVQTSLNELDRYQYYLPLDQSSPNSLIGMVLRVQGTPAAEAERIRKALMPLMPGNGYLTTQPMVELVERTQRSWRLGATMFVSLGVLAVSVASIGLMGLISYAIAQRTREFAIRSALGASRVALVRLIVGPTLRLATIGVGSGILVAWLARHQIQPLLFQQSATDPTAYVIAASALVAVAVGASVAPALHASRVAPAVSLRSE